MGTLSDWVRKGKRAVKKNKKSLTHAAVLGAGYLAWPAIAGAGAGSAAGGAATSGGAAAGGAAAGGAATAGGAAAGAGSGFWGSLSGAAGAGLGYAGAGIAANAGIDLYNRLSGKPTNPYEQGQAARAYNQGAYPGTTPWEQLGGQKPQATDLQVSREQRAHEAAMQQRELESKINIAQIQAGAQREVAGIGADAQIRSSGVDDPSSPQSRQAGAAENQAIASLTQAETGRMRYHFDKWFGEARINIDRTRTANEAQREIAKMLTDVLPKNIADIPAHQYNQMFNQDTIHYIGNLASSMMIRINPEFKGIFDALEDYDTRTNNALIPDSGGYRGPKWTDFQEWYRAHGAKYAQGAIHGQALLHTVKQGFQIYNLFKSAGVPLTQVIDQTNKSTGHGNRFYYRTPSGGIGVQPPFDLGVPGSRFNQGSARWPKGTNYGPE